MDSLPSRFPLHRLGLLLLVVYLLAGAIYSFVLVPDARFPDEKEYMSLSHSLREGPGYSLDGVHLTACRPPGYAFFMAAIQSLGVGVVGVRLVQYLLVVGTILLVYRLCRKDTSFPGLLLVVIGLATIYPVLFYTSATLYPQTLAGFLFILAMAQLVSPDKGLFPNLLTGLTFGALILVVPTFALTLIVALIAAWFLSLVRWRDGLLILVGASLLIGLWTARNAVLFHQFVPLATNSGTNLLIGNCENTTPYGGSGNIDRTHYQQEVQALGLNEFQQDHYYRQAALNWISSHPGRAIVLYFEKVANFFNVYNSYAPENKNEVSFWKQAVMAVSYGTLLLLLAWRLLELKQFPPSTSEKLFLLIYFLSAFTCAIFFTRIRLRLPYDYLIIAVIAIHLSRRISLWLRLPPQ